ncbi:MAG: Si-specific NAD(P)(+) transhydrogenase [Methylotenera sp.]|nr:Si-specific NAD(P)(+) transhydrogenase [Oligoflexia bacterium]
MASSKSTGKKSSKTTSWPALKKGKKTPSKSVQELSAKSAAKAPTATRVFDMIVIGSGPAGQRAALQGAKAGKSVAMIESHPQVGGGCVHVGTLPSKSFRESVYRYSLGSRGTLGQESEHYVKMDLKNSTRKNLPLPDMLRLLRRRDRVVSGESTVIFDQLRRNHITLFQGHARFLTTNDVEVTSAKGKEVVTGDFIFIAVGARPVAPAHLAIDAKFVFDSNTILTLKKVPKSMVVLGAGIIGCEYASMFAMAGTKVHLVDRRNEILASVDREIVNHLVERFDAEGMEILLGCEADKIERKETRRKAGDREAPATFSKVHLSNGRKINAEVVLVSQGRFGNTEGLGLEEVGVIRDDRGLVKVDAHFRTAIPNIYAMGDVIGAPALASTSMEQGRIACCHAFQVRSGGPFEEYKMPVLYPYGIYTIPEISMIGRTEEDLVNEKADFVVGRARYRELARGQIVGDHWGLLKLMVDKKSLKLLGIHIIGDNAADLIHIGQAVMALGGDVNYFINSVFNYPTLAEAYKTAAFHAVNQIKGVTRTI